MKAIEDMGVVEVILGEVIFEEEYSFRGRNNNNRMDRNWENWRTWRQSRSRERDRDR